MKIIFVALLFTTGFVLAFGAIKSQRIIYVEQPEMERMIR